MGGGCVSVRACAGLLQLRVLSFGLLVDGDVGVGVFPESEKALICGFSFRGILLHGRSAGELQASQCAVRIVSKDDAVIKDFLKLGGGLTPFGGQLDMLRPLHG